MHVPALWNLFINDRIHSLPEDSVANFADDNTLYTVNDCLRDLSSKLNSTVNQADTWYVENGMQPNPDKFQSIFFGKTPQCSVNVQDVSIPASGIIYLLGLNVDSRLPFNAHVKNIRIRASGNLNVLKIFG